MPLDEIKKTAHFYNLALFGATGVTTTTVLFAIGCPSLVPGHSFLQYNNQQQLAGTY